MSWRHSQPRPQSRRRALEKCKGKGKTENVVLIDLDNGHFHDVIMVDVPESSQQRLQDPRVTGKKKTLPSRSVISIDDEESGDDDNPGIGVEGVGDVDRHATSSKTYHPSSNQAQDSEELDGNECQFIQERKFPLKLSKCKRTYSKKMLPRNHFGLNPVSESSSSESDGSDCELMNGSSGKIREQWEKAASKKKLFTDVLNGQAGLEDQVSASGSSSDTQKTVEVENTVEQHAEVSVCSSSSNSKVEKEDPSTSAATFDGIMEDPFFKLVSNGPVGDLGRTFDQDVPSRCETQSQDQTKYSYGKVDIQDQRNAFQGESSFRHTKSGNDSGVNHGGASLLAEEEQVPGRTFCFTPKEGEGQFDYGRSCFQEKKENIGEYFDFNTQTANDTHLNHAKASFQTEEASFRKTHEFYGTQVSYDRVVSGDQKKGISREPSFHSIHSPNIGENERASFEDKEKPSSGEPPFCCTELRNDSGVYHGKATLRDKEEVRGRPFRFTPNEGERQFNYGRYCSQEKEENIGEYCNLNAQPGNEMPSFHNIHPPNDKEYEGSSFEDKEIPRSGEPSFCRTGLWGDSGVNHGGASLRDQEVPGIPLCFTPNEGERSCFQEKEENNEDYCSFNTQPRHDVLLNHSKGSFQDEDASVFSTQELNETHISYVRSSFEDKEKQSSGEPCFFDAQSCGKTEIKHCSTQSPEETEVGDERPSQQDNDKSVSREHSLGNAKPIETQLNDGRGSFKDEEKVVLEFLSSTQPQEEISSLIHARDGNGRSDIQNDIIGEREKLKETDEYKRAAEEEWLSRQQQLRIQAEEARRLKRKKKAERRLLDMERRQKQRLEEMRETKKKDEEAINLKEQFRVEVRKELDQLEMKYTDMASLLRGLGIDVGGGLYPMPREVNVAYKKALLKFHPDRAPRTDILQQVEAEEKFKLVSRLKDKLLPAL